MNLVTSMMRVTLSISITRNMFATRTRPIIHVQCSKLHDTRYTYVVHILQLSQSHNSEHMRDALRTSAHLYICGVCAGTGAGAAWNGNFRRRKNMSISCIWSMLSAAVTTIKFIIKYFWFFEWRLWRLWPHAKWEFAEMVNAEKLLCVFAILMGSPQCATNAFMCFYLRHNVPNSDECGTPRKKL